MRRFPPQQTSDSASERPAAFTLVELSVVLLILGLLAGAMAIRTREAIRGGELALATTRLRSFDQMLRERAQKSGEPIDLVLDIENQSAHTQGSAGRDRPQDGRTEIPIHLEEVLVANGRVRSGQRVMRYFADGTSETYAIRLKTDRKRSAFVLIAGWTGQFLETNDERSIEQVLSRLAAERLRAD